MWATFSAPLIHKSIFENTGSARETWWFLNQYHHKNGGFLCRTQHSQQVYILWLPGIFIRQSFSSSSWLALPVRTSIETHATPTFLVVPTIPDKSRDSNSRPSSSHYLQIHYSLPVYIEFCTTRRILDSHLLHAGFLLSCVSTLKLDVTDSSETSIHIRIF
jgi:hypothetical protein